MYMLVQKLLNVFLNQNLLGVNAASALRVQCGQTISHNSRLPTHQTAHTCKLPTHEANRTTKQGVRYATNREDKVWLSDGGKISFPDRAGAPARYKERLSLTLKMTRVTCAVRLQRQAGRSASICGTDSYTNNGAHEDIN